ncbi:MAG: hypothetical protein IKZ49_04065 [Alphaproteobacteria bacterium]|nr:hypothetical protein [Alphaproteobacteria bacterium]
MKRIIPFFAVCLALSVFQADDCYSATQQKNTNKRETSNIVSVPHSGSRVSSSTKQPSTKVEDVDKSRTTTKPNRTIKSEIAQQKETSVKSRNTATQKVKQRAATTKKVVSKVARTTTNNTPSVHVVESRKSVDTGRSATKTISRATRTQAMLDSEKIAKLKNNTYSKCKTLFYECMDEFCANKDSNLRRCACSSRIHEFDKIKKQLSDAEDKMLDFNQRLLSVSLSKEDAAAINVASEGEIGFNQKDKSESEKLLQKITNTLNSDGNSKLNNDLSAISLSLDVDSAFDSIDSASGIATTTKNGVELYNAVLPTCIEMAKEVCSESNLDIVQGNYKMAIQQDCETVSKSYSTQYTNAINKINESSALLDMARLNTYQSKNSDDVLTCRKKILEQLYNPAVCGNDLYKCLDTTGQYINPATGEAFLSTNLYDITTLLTAPVGDETWATKTQNEKFVAFLNSKKEYLTTATSQCQNMVPVIWKDFLNDALGKIKLAQNAKLEEIRQSCTTLVAECRSNATKNLSDFDARALSTFKVLADTTIASLCQSVQNSCLSLMKASGGGEDFWNTGIDNIAKDTSFDAIIETCTTLGKDCIIQQCNGTSGNFALCQKYTSQPRRAILSRSACWNEVLDCVKQSVYINKVNEKNTLIVRQTLSDDGKSGRYDYYEQLYGEDVANNLSEENNGVPEFCEPSDKACLIAEQIWGNCEHNPLNTAIKTFTDDNNDEEENSIKATNKILIPAIGAESLLSWLAKNTDTTESIDSCSAYKCPVNYHYNSVKKSCSMLFNGGKVCGYNKTSSDNSPSQPKTIDEVISTIEGTSNYCSGGKSSIDSFGNCCASGAVNSGLCVPDSTYNVLPLLKFKCNISNNTSSTEGDTETSTENADLSRLKTYYCASETPNENEVYREETMNLYCITTNRAIDVDGSSATCTNGFFLLVDTKGNYFAYNSNFNNNIVMQYYKTASDSCTTCSFEYQAASNRWIITGSGCASNGGGWENHAKGDFTIVYRLNN